MTILKWAGIAFISLILFLILVIALINWNWVRDVAARQVSETLGRTLIIEGDLSVDWSRTLHIRVEQIRLENATWSKEPYMFELAALDFHIDLVDLIKGRLIFPRVTLINPSVILETSFEGEPNWDLPLDFDVKFPVIKRLIIDDSRMIYRDLSTNTADITLTFSTIRAQADDEENLKLQAHGKLNGKPLAIALNAGSLLALQKLENPFPLALSVQAMGKEVNGKRTLVQLLQLKGNLSRQENIWQFANLNGQIGESDLAGNVSVDIGSQRLFVKANITSNKINLDDFATLIDFVSNIKSDDSTSLAKKQEKSQKEVNSVVLSRNTLDLESLQHIDANISFKGNHVASKVPVNNLKIQLLLDQGHLSLAIPDFGIAAGNVQLRIELDVTNKPSKSKIEVEMRRVKLNEILRSLEISGENLGVIGGQGIFWFKGDSVAEILASADGGLLMLMDGGKLDALLVELSGLDVGESLIKLLGHREAVEINCIFLDLPTKNGVMNMDSLVVDTEDTLYLGKGSIDFTQERLDLVIDPKPKDLSLYSARAPLHIKGSFKDPSILPEASAILRGVASLALLPAAPIVGLIGLLSEKTKDHEDMRCSGFVKAINKARK